MIVNDRYGMPRDLTATDVLVLRRLERRGCVEIATFRRELPTDMSKAAFDALLGRFVLRVLGAEGPLAYTMSGFGQHAVIDDSGRRAITF